MPKKVLAGVAVLGALSVAACGSSREVAEQKPQPTTAVVKVDVDVREGIGGEIQGRCVSLGGDGSTAAHTLTDLTVDAVRIECAMQNTGWGSASLRYRVRSSADSVNGIVCDSGPVPRNRCAELRDRFGFRLMCDKPLSTTENELRRTSAGTGEYGCSVTVGSKESGMLVIESTHQALIPLETEEAAEPAADSE